MNLLVDLDKLLCSGRAYGFIALAQRLASFEEQCELQRKFRDFEAGFNDGGLDDLTERYDAIPLVKIESPPKEPPPPPPSGTRLSTDCFRAREPLFGRRCRGCGRHGHTRRKCPQAA